MINYVHGIRLIESDYGYYLYNAHGDVVQVVKDGTVISRYDYDAYGIPKNPDLTDKNDKNPFRYTGEYQDLATGYIYLRARFYSPELGRFINEDPIKDGGNWHGYAGGNPMMFSNPSGLKVYPKGFISPIQNKRRKLDRKRITRKSMERNQCTISQNSLAIIHQSPSNKTICI